MRISIRLASSVIFALVVMLAACGFIPPSASPVMLSAPPVTSSPVLVSTVTATPSPATVHTTIPTVVPAYTLLTLAPTPTLALLNEDQRGRIFELIWTRVHDHYVYTDYHGVDWQKTHDLYVPRVSNAASTEAFYVLMREMIKSLGDDHSRFDSPQAVAINDSIAAGALKYGGIGGRNISTPEGDVVVRLVRDGPADLGGLRTGDVIEAVNGISATNKEALGPEGLAGAIRGQEGTSVRLSVRSPDGKLRSLDIVRNIISQSDFEAPVGIRLPGTQVGLLTITSFEFSDTAERVRIQLQKLIDAAPLDGLIIDLRLNGGGQINQMLQTLKWFCDGGSIGIIRGRESQNNMQVARGATLVPFGDIPLVVLTSRSTQSAAELFASGMQLLRHVRIVGLPSAGNTEAVYPTALPDGSRLWLAESIYYRPDGTMLEGKGVKPDHLVEPNWFLFGSYDDPQILAALEVLRKK